MQAALFHNYGGPEVLRLEEVPLPEVKPGHILIKILSAGINRLENYLRDGSYTQNLKLPHALGSDAAGEVAAVGDGVTGFQIGQRVIPMPGYPLAPEDYDYAPISAAPSYAVMGVFEWGTYAQYLAVPARWVLKDETGLTPALAATLPMVVTTSVRALKTVGEVKPGDRVLIHAGASGTGSMAIQVAHALGAKVAATVNSPRKIRFVQELGTELVIDTTKEDFVAKTLAWTGGRGADVVIDNLGGPILGRSVAAVRRQGVVVAIGFVSGLEVSFNIRDFFFDQKQIRGSLMGTKEDLEWGLGLVAKGAIRPLLDRVLPLREAAAAHRLLAGSEISGNLVLDPW